MTPPPVRSSLFPYTTLFRSVWMGKKPGWLAPFVFCALSVSLPGQTVSTEILGLVTDRSEEHTSELQSHSELVCRLLLEKKNARRRPQPYAACAAPMPTDARQ